MKRFIVFCFLVAGMLSAFAGTRSLRAEATHLLTRWMDTFLTYQLHHPDEALDGGVICPACARVHGRIGDAVLPLMYLADTTGDVKYLNGACRLMKWMENVHRPDGSWMNDVHVSDWNGTTVFAAIALYEALHHHGHLLDDATRRQWEERLQQAGDFIMANPKIYSCDRTPFGRNCNINYQASATYALRAIGEYFHRDDLKREADVVARDVRKFFTPNEGFLYGEGGPLPWDATRNGCRPVDLLYNVEESLPHLASYARLAGDEELLQLVKRSMDTHLEFMLPDGAWDNNWGTRSFKWTYWGGRTSDGFMGGYYQLSDLNPLYLEAISRNIDLLSRSTLNGLLYAGSHYDDCGVSPCIHHTFGHAKAIASFLVQPVSAAEVAMEKCETRQALPREKEYGMKHFRDIRTWLFACGSWRATFTGYDSEYKVKGTHPMGGALSLLWHSIAGPVFAAGMNDYTLIESPNMQSNERRHLINGTPRVELEEDGVVYSNLDDLDTDIKCVQQGDAYRLDVTTHLVDKNQQAPRSGKVTVRMSYTISEQGVMIEMPRAPKGIRLVLPVISAPGDSHAHIAVSCHKGTLQTLPVDDDGRVFNPVPGFSFVPFMVIPDSNELKVAVTFVRI